MTDYEAQLKAKADDDRRRLDELTSMLSLGSPMGQVNKHIEAWDRLHGRAGGGGLGGTGAGDWRGLQFAGGDGRDYAAENAKAREFTMKTGMRPQEFDEAARVRFLENQKPPTAIAPGITFDAAGIPRGGVSGPAQFNRPTSDTNLESFMAGIGGNNILNRQSAVGVNVSQYAPPAAGNPITPKGDLLATYKQMQADAANARITPWLRTTKTPTAHNFLLDQLGAQIKQLRAVAPDQRTPVETDTLKDYEDMFNKIIGIKPTTTAADAADAAAKETLRQNQLNLIRRTTEKIFGKPAQIPAIPIPAAKKYKSIADIQAAYDKREITAAEAQSLAKSLE